MVVHTEKSSLVIQKLNDHGLMPAWSLADRHARPESGTRENSVVPAT
jgi:hypothetical protein